MPNVNWNDNQLKVNWYNPDNANDNLRAREVASARIIPVLLGLFGEVFYPPADHFRNDLEFLFRLEVLFEINYTNFTSNAD